LTAAAAAATRSTSAMARSRCCEAVCGKRLRLSFASVLCNVLFSITLFVAIMGGGVGLYTYSWIETTSEKMAEAQITAPAYAPGLTAVSCGLLTYCIDASGAVSECALPWPTYGNLLDPDDYPTRVWSAAAGCIASGVGLLSVGFLYTLIACFGCFYERLQRIIMRLVELGGALLFAGLMCFGFSTRDMAVNDDRCTAWKDGVNGTDCTAWTATLPSQVIEGNGNHGCRICPEGQGPFQLNTVCSFGWGGIAVICATVLAFGSLSCGSRVLPRKKQVKYVPSKSTRRKKAKTSKERGWEWKGPRDAKNPAHPPEIVTRIENIQNIEAAARERSVSRNASAAAPEAMLDTRQGAVEENSIVDDSLYAEIDLGPAENPGYDTDAEESYSRRTSVDDDAGWGRSVRLEGSPELEATSSTDCIELSNLQGPSSSIV